MTNPRIIPNSGPTRTAEPARQVQPSSSENSSQIAPVLTIREFQEKSETNVARSPGRRREDTERLNHDSEIALSERQQDVTRLIAEGMSSKAIAYRLSISEKTVEFHRRNSMAKARARSTAELIRFAVEKKFVGPLITELKPREPKAADKRRRSDK